MGYMYLASPYSAPTLQVRVNRFMAAQDAVIACFHAKIPVYSPIQVWHHIKELEKIPMEYEFYKAQNDAMLTAAESIGVLIIPGWRESKGVRAELEQARRLDLRCFTVIGPWLGKAVGFSRVEMDFKSWSVASVLAQ